MTYGECENCWMMGSLCQVDDGRWICYGCMIHEIPASIPLVKDGKRAKWNEYPKGVSPHNDIIEVERSRK